MISSRSIQSEYQRLYVVLRQYLWPFDIVEIIADLEAECFTTFPDLSKIINIFDKFKRAASDLLTSDDELKKAVENFNEVIISDNVTYLKLDKVKETIEQ